MVRVYITPIYWNKKKEMVEFKTAVDNLESHYRLHFLNEFGPQMQVGKQELMLKYGFKYQDGIKSKWLPVI